MKFGLLYEIELHPRATFDQAPELYWQCLEEIKLADRVGFDYVWEVEHHFLWPFSASSAPEVFLSAVAQHTERIRIGHGVVLLPGPYNHPVRVAERAAVLDIMSRGRLEFGTGRSATRQEIEGFGIDPDETRPLWEEALRMIPQMWQSDLFSWDGKYYQIPPRVVAPKPVQKPHPPIWMAGTQPSSGRLAGEKGIGFLHFALTGPAVLREAVDSYHDSIAHAQPVGAFVNNQMAALTLAYCGEDDREAIEVGGRGPLYYQIGTQRLFSAWGETGAESYRWYAEEAGRLPDKETADVKRLVDEGVFCVGGPETCRQIVKSYQNQGIDQLIVIMQFAATPHEKVMDSIRRFGEEVIPAFR